MCSLGAARRTFISQILEHGPHLGGLTPHKEFEKYPRWPATFAYSCGAFQSRVWLTLAGVLLALLSAVFNTAGVPPSRLWNLTLEVGVLLVLISVGVSIYKAAREARHQEEDLLAWAGTPAHSGVVRPSIGAGALPPSSAITARHVLSLADRTQDLVHTAGTNKMFSQPP